jgi:hypothetical protein
MSLSVKMVSEYVLRWYNTVVIFAKRLYGKRMFTKWRP